MAQKQATTTVIKLVKGAHGEWIPQIESYGSIYELVKEFTLRDIPCTDNTIYDIIDPNGESWHDQYELKMEVGPKILSADNLLIILKHLQSLDSQSRMQKKCKSLGVSIRMMWLRSLFLKSIKSLRPKT